MPQAERVTQWLACALEFQLDPVCLGQYVQPVTAVQQDHGCGVLEYGRPRTRTVDPTAIPRGARHVQIPLMRSPRSISRGQAATSGQVAQSGWRG